ncbi:PIG-L deacetylase family protein [Melghirimyces algeriensis]|uniref:N-acetylglucosaminyl deacetylase, LmbE family n=1 Tax=Melghirimyces algeriensis TaxID=910412 RepID=A0A521B4A1_9BACL|nr:PIG-L deacetylase family protein [Melghirimyces algeriensis]SMO41912.1 N-acetylglucosaminyl deacetylase, LmbE family [Melghirimyces algeriensis]
MKNKLMFIYAHPDDETFASGGTILQYAHQPGWEVTLYCATRGEGGSTGTPPLCPQHRLGEVRADELAKAAKVLGIDRVILRDFGDGKLANVPFHILVDDITQSICKEQPSAVITFPSHGISGHPDHQTIHQATTEAIRQIQKNRMIQLYYIVIPQSVAKEQTIYTTPDQEVTNQVNVSVWRKKIMEALQCHKTQQRSVERVFPGVSNGHWEHLRTFEYYQKAGTTGIFREDGL